MRAWPLLTAVFFLYHFGTGRGQNTSGTVALPLTSLPSNSLSRISATGPYKIDLSASGSWVLGIIADDAKAPAYQAGFVHFAPAKRGESVHRVVAIDTAPAGSISVSESSITATSTDPAVSVAMLLFLSPGLPIVVTANGQTIYSGTQSNTLLLKDGTRVPIPVAGMQTVLGVLSIGRPPAEIGQPQLQNQGNVRKLMNGEFFADIPALKTHLKSSIKPEYQSSVLSATARLGFLIHIDASGFIIDVNPSTDSELSPAATAAIKQWTFEPFFADGAQVPVTARLFLLVHPDGSVTSPLFSQ